MNTLESILRVTAETAFAQTSGGRSYELLAPLPGLGSSVPAGGTANYLQILFNAGIAVAVALAVIVMIWGGFQYLSTDAFSGKSEGKEKITRALWGLLLALGIVVILNTLNPNLVKMDLTLEPLKRIAVTEQPPPGPGTDPRLQQMLSTESANRGLLAGSVTFNNGPCTQIGQRNCTSVGGLPQKAISDILSLRTQCSCDLVITGGTEWWLHTTHDVGRCVVDFRRTDGLTTYLVGSSEPQPGQQVTKAGIRFTYERVGTHGYSTGSHWHAVSQVCN